MKLLLTAFARNTVFANIITALLLLSGVIASKSTIREVFPEFSLDIITISVAYPGADPEEVEEGINRKIEEAIEGLEGIRQYTTSSRENLGSATIEVKKGYDVAEVLDRVKSKVDAISSFPVDAEKPIMTELLLKDTVMLIYLSGNMSERRLKEWGEQIKDELQQLPKVSQVSLFGARDYEVGIEVSEQRLQEYGLSFEKVAAAVRESNLNLAGGTIRTQGEEIRVRTVGRKYTGRDMAAIVVVARPDGELITLDRLATINDGFTDDPIIATVNGAPSLLLIVSKTKEEDALAISEAVGAYLDRQQKILPPDVNVKTLYNSTEMLRARINLLVKNGIIGLLLVLFLLWAFLAWRLSLWAGMGIPISLAGGLTILWLIGGTINMISLFGMIMVLGIVVDDAIVVSEAIFVHRRNGKPPLAAAVEGLYEVGIPVIAAVTTTIITFLPLAFIGGIMGKFIAILPTMVIACLVVSLVECLLLLPAHLSHLPDPNAPSRSHNRLYRRLNRFHAMMSEGLEWFVEHIYAPFITRILNWRYVSFCTAVAILLLSIGFIKGGFLKFEVFPAVDGIVITSNVQFPSGTPPSVTKEAVRQMEEAIQRIAARSVTRSGEPLIKDRLAFVGMHIGAWRDSGPHLGGVQAILLDSEKRGIDSKDLLVQWEKEIGLITGVEALTFETMEQGPPGAPIEIWVQGHDLDTILAASNQVLERLQSFDGVYQIRSDFSPGKNEIRLSLKPEARGLGLTVDDLARQVYAGYYGQEAVRLQRGRDDVRVRVRYPADERQQVADLDKIRIRSRDGSQIPLHSVAEITFAPGYSTITRTDGMRRIMISADVNTNKANANEILTELGNGYFESLEQAFPGIRVSAQGEKKKMAESFDSLKIGFPLAMLGIFVIIATTFRSYAQPFVIMFTIPFGIIGAILGHLIMGYELSLMSVFGMVALSGVVVNDAIVLIERVNENIAAGMLFTEAIVNAGRRRFRAIFLTTISTVGGLAPLILETDLQAKFLIPMALALAGGLLFATLLTLILIPSMLVILNDFRRLAYKLRHRRWPSREEVEPALERTDAPLAQAAP